jgi:hypothetical protein
MYISLALISPSCFVVCVVLMPSVSCLLFGGVVVDGSRAGVASLPFFFFLFLFYISLEMRWAEFFLFYVRALLCSFFFSFLFCLGRSSVRQPSDGNTSNADDYNDSQCWANHTGWRRQFQ